GTRSRARTGHACCSYSRRGPAPGTTAAAACARALPLLSRRRSAALLTSLPAAVHEAIHVVHQRDVEQRKEKRGHDHRDEVALRTEREEHEDHCSEERAALDRPVPRRRLRLASAA